MSDWQMVVLVYELAAILLIEMIGHANRWADAHPEENARIAAIHDRQDRLEGRY